MTVATPTSHTSPGLTPRENLQMFRIEAPKERGGDRLGLGVKDRRRLDRRTDSNGRKFQRAGAPVISVDLMTPSGSLQLDDPRIFRLWARWVPRLRSCFRSAEIPALRDEHARWVERLLRVGLSTHQIKRTRLDTPLLPLPQREEWLRVFLSERAKRQLQAKKKTHAAPR
jgi:hypothetical protein